MTCRTTNRRRLGGTMAASVYNNGGTPTRPRYEHAEMKVRRPSTVRYETGYGSARVVLQMFALSISSRSLIFSPAFPGTRKTYPIPC
jgi:hypothetical protein